jgi:hypothetical protein
MFVLAIIDILIPKINTDTFGRQNYLRTHCSILYTRLTVFVRKKTIT